MTEFIHSVLAAEQAMQGIVVHAFVQVFLRELNVLIHGDWASKKVALLLLLGLSIMFRRGLWKMVLKVFGRWVWKQA